MRTLGLIVLLTGGILLNARTVAIRRFEDPRYRITPFEIVQDKTGGQLWLAAAEGLFVFDGLRFRRVQVPSEMGLEQPSHLAVDQEGSIWIGTSTGLIRFKDGTFRIEAHGSVQSLTVIRNGTLLAEIAFMRGGEMQNDLYLRPNSPGKPGWILVYHGVISDPREDKDGNLWFACQGYVNVCVLQQGRWKLQ